MLGEITLVTGGAKSGKSVWAEQYVRDLSEKCIYIATAEVGDDEMAQRIAEHQARRDSNWTLVEQPRDLVGALNRSDGQGARLVDCLTLWLTNEMLASDGEWRAALSELVECLTNQTSPVVLVTNEVGSGIVPENALARRFQDATGLVNQTIGNLADRVVFVVAGQALAIKGTL